MNSILLFLTLFASSAFALDNNAECLKECRIEYNDCLRNGTPQSSCDALRQLCVIDCENKASELSVSSQSAEEYFFERSQQTSVVTCEKSKNLTYSILHKFFASKGGAISVEPQIPDAICDDSGVKVFYAVLNDGRGCVVSVSNARGRVVYSNCH